MQKRGSHMITKRGKSREQRKNLEQNPNYAQPMNILRETGAFHNINASLI